MMGVDIKIKKIMFFGLLIVLFLYSFVMTMLFIDKNNIIRLQEDEIDNLKKDNEMFRTYIDENMPKRFIESYDYEKDEV